MCRNGRDDDQDDLIDYPNDPGCESANDTDERDPDELPECFDQIDNDEDGLTDFPADGESCFMPLTQRRTTPVYASKHEISQACLARVEAASMRQMISKQVVSPVQEMESVLRWRVLEDRPLQRLLLKTTDSDMNTVISVRTGVPSQYGNRV